MFDLAQHRKAHRGLGVVPRIDDAAVVPGDRAVVALQVEDAGAGAVEMAVGDRVAVAEMRHDASPAKSWALVK